METVMRFETSLTFLFLPFLFVGCTEHPDKTTSLNDVELNGRFIGDSGRWTIVVEGDLCTEGELDDEIQLWIAFPDSDGEFGSWSRAGTVALDERDGCVSVGGARPLPIQAASVEAVAVATRIDQVRDLIIVDGIYGAACVTGEGDSMELSFEPGRVSCE